MPHSDHAARTSGKVDVFREILSSDIELMHPHSQGSSLISFPTNSSFLRAVKHAIYSHGCGGLGSKNDILLSERSSAVSLTRFLMAHPNPYEWMTLLLTFKSNRQVKKQRLGLISSTKLNDRSSFSRVVNLKTTLGIVDKLLFEALRLTSFLLNECEIISMKRVQMIEAYKVDNS